MVQALMADGVECRCKIDVHGIDVLAGVRGIGKAVNQPLEMPGRIVAKAKDLLGRAEDPVILRLFCEDMSDESSPGFIYATCDAYGALA